MSESESAGALGTLFFYVLFVHPVCAWILSPKRFRKDRAIVYAILFLATIAFGKMVSKSLIADHSKQSRCSTRPLQIQEYLECAVADRSWLEGLGLSLET